MAVDELGRELPTYEEVGELREDKIVAVFYYLWHVPRHIRGVYNITEIIEENPDNPQFGPQRFHYWGEPYFGYYRMDVDRWVYRKHAQMLVDAGVDVIILEATNGITYSECYVPLLEEYRKIRNEGGVTPEIAFIVNGARLDLAERAFNELYEDVYSENKFEELWFEWQGKPLIWLHQKAYQRKSVRSLQYVIHGPGQDRIGLRMVSINGPGWIILHRIMGGDWKIHLTRKSLMRL